MDPTPETQYMITGADGNEYGPVTADQVREWVREGRANARTRARPHEGGDWKMLAEFPEFMDAVAPPPQAFVPGVSAEPASMPLPEDILERDYDLEIGSCLSRAIELLKNQFGLVMGGSAIFIGIQILASLLGNIPLLGALIALVNIVLYGPLLGGLYFFLLKVMRGQRSQAGDVFSGFRRNLPQLILGYLLTMILTFLSAAPGGIVMAFGIVPQVMRQEFQPLLAILASLGFLLSLIPVIYLSTCWIYTVPLIIDKQMEFWPAMETSRKVVNKHWINVFILVLITSVLNLVGMLMCCIGVFVSIPVSHAALMYGYEEIFCRPTAENA